MQTLTVRADEDIFHASPYRRGCAARICSHPEPCALPLPLWINCKKSLCHILVYSALTDTKLPGRLADRSLMLDDIIGDLNCTFFNIFFLQNPCIVRFLQSMQGIIDVCLCLKLPSYNARLILNITLLRRISLSSAPTNISESSATYFLCQRDSSYAT